MENIIEKIQNGISGLESFGQVVSYINSYKLQCITDGMTDSYRYEDVESEIFIDISKKDFLDFNHHQNSFILEVSKNEYKYGTTYKVYKISFKSKFFALVAFALNNMIDLIKSVMVKNEHVYFVLMRSYENNGVLTLQGHIRTNECTYFLNCTDSDNIIMPMYVLKDVKGYKYDDYSIEFNNSDIDNNSEILKVLNDILVNANSEPHKSIVVNLFTKDNKLDGTYTLTDYEDSNFQYSIN